MRFRNHLRKAFEDVMARWNSTRNGERESERSLIVEWKLGRARFSVRWESVRNEETISCDAIPNENSIPWLRQSHPRLHPEHAAHDQDVVWWRHRFRAGQHRTGYDSQFYNWYSIYFENKSIIVWATVLFHSGATAKQRGLHEEDEGEPSEYQDEDGYSFPDYVNRYGRIW